VSYSPYEDRSQGIELVVRSALPVRERAYGHVKALILAGQFPPGQRLVEERLAQELGISRTPIREALHKLASEGLIPSPAARGFGASPDLEQEIEELFELRAVLEGHALRVICGRLTTRELLELDETVRKTEVALHCQRLDEVFLWNKRFHHALHEMISDKRRLHDQIVTMRQYAFRYRDSVTWDADDGRRTVEGHRRIVTALRLRDPDLCERVMREHIQRPQRRLQPDVGVGMTRLNLKESPSGAGASSTTVRPGRTARGPIPPPTPHRSTQLPA
jgi:DNA-binding GntR family transcriptional regulator